MWKSILFFEKWVKKLIVVQLVFLVVAQVLLHFHAIVPYVNEAVVYEGVIDLLKPAAESVMRLLFGPDSGTI
ncbi:MAG TPA: DUF5359 family protein [Bacillales bacterium]|nr:DUF5359 family protein [Bacillales bacterium]